MQLTVSCVVRYFRVLAVGQCQAARRSHSPQPSRTPIDRQITFQIRSTTLAPKFAQIWMRYELKMVELGELTAING